MKLLKLLAKLFKRTTAKKAGTDGGWEVVASGPNGHPDVTINGKRYSQHLTISRR